MTDESGRIPELPASKYLGQMVRVTISDGRCIEGELRCIDKDMNLVLGQATEYYGVESDQAVQDKFLDETSSRSLGSAMIPGIHVRNVFAKHSNE